MKKMVFGVVCALCATMGLAVPKASWVPANADVVAVGVQDSVAVKAAHQMWLDALKAVGVDWEELMAQAVDDDDDAKPMVEICNLVTADAANAKYPTYTSMVASVVLPRNLAACMEDDVNAAKEFAMYGFIENPKLDMKALAAKIESLVADKKDEVTLTRKDAWYVLTEVKEADETDEPQAVIAYRQMATGIMWTLGCTPTIIATADALEAGTAAPLAETSPLRKAFADDIVKAKVSKGTAIIGDVTGIVKRAVKDPEALAAIEMRTPMLLKTKSAQMTAELNDKAIYAMTVSAEMEDTTMAEQLRDMLLGFKAMGGMMLAADPNMAELAKFLNAIKISSETTTATLAVQIDPATGCKLYKSFMEMAEAQSQSYGADIDDVDLDDEIEDMTEEEAEELLKAL